MTEMATIGWIILYFFLAPVFTGIWVRACPSIEHMDSYEALLVLAGVLWPLFAVGVFSMIIHRLVAKGRVS